VSEASEIVSNAAHEDANIIFGAVVDPKMEGQVKITVIATGFDRGRLLASPGAQERKDTPTDLSMYAMAKTQADERLVPVMPRPIVVRRPVIDLPMAATRGSMAVAMPTGEPGEDDDASPLDIPAFLRRQES
jgi:cell division protein FtsZ